MMYEKIIQVVLFFNSAFRIAAFCPSSIVIAAIALLKNFAARGNKPWGFASFSVV
jgi:hypothetical protein